MKTTQFQTVYLLNGMVWDCSQSEYKLELNFSVVIDKKPEKPYMFKKTHLSYKVYNVNISMHHSDMKERVVEKNNIGRIYSNSSNVLTAS